jgi:putative DNA primase/helicase
MDHSKHTDVPDQACGNVAQSPTKCTVASLAYNKHLLADFLGGPSIGLTDLPPGGVGIPYYDETGHELFVRERESRGSRFRQPKDVPLRPYGLWRLHEAAKEGVLILVEGESDCWTLWFHGFSALGIPGATASKTLLREHIEAVEKIYVSREPDKGGDTFVDGIVKRLRKLGYEGRVFELRMPDGIKDPSDLHIEDLERFKERIADAIKQSTELTELELVDEQDEPTLNGVAGTPHDALTDTSNAKVFVGQHCEEVRYCHPWTKWLCWDGLRWREDDTGQPMLRAKETALSLLREAIQW